MIIQEAPNLWRSLANRNAKEVSCIGMKNLAAIGKQSENTLCFIYGVHRAHTGIQDSVLLIRWYILRIRRSPWVIIIGGLSAEMPSSRPNAGGGNVAIAE